MYQNRGGGYYFDAGCSQMIVDGRIGLIQFDDIERFCAEGARLKDGSVQQADLIVLATGYLGQKEAVRRIVGDAITDRIGRRLGFRRRRRARRHVAADRSARPVVLRRRAGAMPDLFQGAGAADQGERIGDCGVKAMRGSPHDRSNAMTSSSAFSSRVGGGETGSSPP